MFSACPVLLLWLAAPSAGQSAAPKLEPSMAGVDGAKPRQAPAAEGPTGIDFLVPQSTFAPPHAGRLRFWQVRTRLLAPSAATIDADLAGLQACLEAEPALHYAGAELAGRALLALNRPEAALAYWQRATVHAPTSELALAARAWRATALRLLGRRAQASAAWPVPLSEVSSLPGWQGMLAAWQRVPDRPPGQAKAEAAFAAPAAPSAAGTCAKNSAATSAATSVATVAATSAAPVSAPVSAPVAATFAGSAEAWDDDSSAAQSADFALLLDSLGEVQSAPAARTRADPTAVKGGPRSSPTKRAATAMRGAKPHCAAYLAIVPLALARRDIAGATSLLVRANKQCAPWPAGGAGEALRLQAEVVMRARDYPRAIAAWLALIRRGPPAGRSNAWGRLGHAYLATEQFAEAAPALHQASFLAEHRGEQEAWLFQAAEAHFFAHEYAEAFGCCLHLEQLFPHGPHSASALWFAAFSAHCLYDDASAQRLLRLLVERNDGQLTPQAEYWLGRIAEAHGQGGDGEYWYRQAMRRPWSFYALLARGHLLALPLWPAGMRGIGRGQGQQLASSAKPAPGPAEANLWQSERAGRLRALLAYDLAELAPSELPLLPWPRNMSLAEACLSKAELGAWLGLTPLAARLATRALDATGQEPLAPERLEAAYALAWPTAFAGEVQRAADEWGVDPRLLWAVMRQESAFAPAARSVSNAQGLMQLLPVTASRIAAALAEQGLGQGGRPGSAAQHAQAALAEPGENVAFGAWYLARLQDNFPQQLPLAVAAYNAGPLAVRRWLGPAATRDVATFVETIPKAETRRYTKEVLANWAVYSHSNGGPAPTLPRTLSGESHDVVNF